MKQLVTEWWGDQFIVVHGAFFFPHQLPGFMAVSARSTIEGLATYSIDGRSCEMITLNTTSEKKGIGSALFRAVVHAAQKAECSRMWLITTNDNLNALGFYQKRGMTLVAVHQGAVERSRALKPSIPTIGANGIPIRDEIELELLLGA